MPHSGTSQVAAPHSRGTSRNRTPIPHSAQATTRGNSQDPLPSAMNPPRAVAATIMAADQTSPGTPHPPHPRKLTYWFFNDTATTEIYTR